MVHLAAEEPCLVLHAWIFEDLLCTGDGEGSAAGGESHWQAIPVSQISEGDSVWVCLQGAARHTGIAITESITEK